jgi:hypothetical protein
VLRGRASYGRRTRCGAGGTNDSNRTDDRDVEDDDDHTFRTF